MRKPLLVLCLLMTAGSIAAQYLYDPPRHYRCLFTSEPVIIDGSGEEAAWQKVPWSEYFVDIEGSAKPTPYQDTRIKMLWDTNHLYILAQLIEKDVWATLRNRDDIIYRDNDFEVFIDPDQDGHNYFEIEVNAFNTLFDLFLSAPYRDGGPVLTDWDLKGMQSAIKVVGTLNDPTDRDSCWMVEMALPFTGLCRKGYNPKPGSSWKINFSRVQYETIVQDGAYRKRRSPEGKVLPENNWVWAPQGIINMHYPEQWGYLLFDSDQDLARIPSDDAVVQHLYVLYHRLRAYRDQQGVYPAQIEKIHQINGIRYSCSYTVANASYLLSLYEEDSTISWSINEVGRVNRSSP